MVVTWGRAVRCMVAATGAIFAAVLASCSSTGVVPTNVAVSETIVLTSGPIVGAPRDADGVLAFKGIPYAAPPIATLRWRAPQPLLPWTAPREARTFGPTCWQSAPFDGDVDKALAAAPGGFSEDCLFANVWTAARDRGARLPVMVWLHGGGFQFGSGNLPARGASNPPLVKKGVVLVSINYRLGVFGSFAHPELGSTEGRGAQGLLDMLAALRWVRENAARFGGDPGNVTVFGESAGAHAVGILMASPLAQGLFHKAIGQSGAFWESENGPSRPLAAVEAQGTMLATRLNAPSLAALRGVSALALQKATNWTFATDPSAAHWSPVVDGQVLPEPAYERFAQGRQNDVPLLVGWNASEGFPIFANRSLAWTPPGTPAKTAADFDAALARRFGPLHADAARRLYGAATADETTRSANTLIGDELISYQTWAWAVAQRRTGRSPVYVYHFDHRSPFMPLAMHTAEIPFVFNDLSGQFAGRPPAPNAPAAAPVDLQLADRMAGYWVNFARSGDPNGAGLPAWPRFEGPGSQVMRLNAQPSAGPDPGAERYLFLHRWKGR